jgi:hypothetical protein
MRAQSGRHPPWVAPCLAARGRRGLETASHGHRQIPRLTGFVPRRRECDCGPQPAPTTSGILFPTGSGERVRTLKNTKKHREPCKVDTVNKRLSHNYNPLRPDTSEPAFPVLPHLQNGWFHCEERSQRLCIYRPSRHHPNREIHGSPAR